jgi:hypothetical protein
LGLWLSLRARLITINACKTICGLSLDSMEALDSLSLKPTAHYREPGVGAQRPCKVARRTVLRLKAV